MPSAPEEKVMTLDETLLQKLADWRPGEGSQVLSVSHPASGWSVALTADGSGPLGCLVWEVTLRRTPPLPGRDAPALQSWAERIGRRATGLLEALKTIEVDANRDEAIVRSEGPALRGEGIFYYELLLRGTGEVVCRRYRATADGKDRRQQVAFALTHEALAKLARDVTADK
jgi:hypothetical protein